MSVHCRVGANPAPLLRVLSVLAVGGSDTWATLVFTPRVVIAHVAGSELSTTATATISTALFLEYTVTGDPRCMVHLGSLTDALTLCGTTPLLLHQLKVLLAYPTHDSRLLVELSDTASCRIGQSMVVTRPVPERLLDLRFGDSVAVHRVELRGDALREVLTDLIAFQVQKVQISVNSTQATITGEGSPHGTLRITIPSASDAVLQFDCGDSAVVGQFLMPHFAVACGVSRTTRSGGLSAGGHGSTGWTETFERLTLILNNERQLSAVHQNRDDGIPVTVSVVITPLFEM